MNHKTHHMILLAEVAGHVHPCGLESPCWKVNSRGSTVDTSKGAGASINYDNRFAIQFYETKKRLDMYSLSVTNKQSLFATVARRKVSGAGVEKGIITPLSLSLTITFRRRASFIHKINEFSGQRQVIPLRCPDKHFGLKPAAGIAEHASPGPLSAA